MEEPLLLILNKVVLFIPRADEINRAIKILESKNMIDEERKKFKNKVN